MFPICFIYIQHHAISVLVQYHTHRVSYTASISALLEKYFNVYLVEYITYRVVWLGEF